MKENALYADNCLVPLYDILNQWGIDSDFYFRLAGVDPMRILDSGCGTGMLALEYAKAGHDVVGIDPAPKMLEVAIARDSECLVDWQLSKLQNFKNSQPFDLIVMTGHAFQCLITDDDIFKAFNSITQLLDNNGCFVFESRNPAVRTWENWTPKQSSIKKQNSEGLSFEMFNNVLNVDNEKVTFETHYLLSGETEAIISRSTLRFASLGKIEALADSAGLAIDTVFGDWDRSVLQNNSPEIIVTLRRC